MKIQFHIKDQKVIDAFMDQWIPENPNKIQALLLGVWNSEECPPLYLDCCAEELANCFDNLNREGFAQSIKKLFAGDHFYRSDTGKCPRCWRYRPEIFWNNEHLPDHDAELCDRCNFIINQEEKEETNE